MNHRRKFEREAKQYLDCGFRAAKMKVGLGVERDAQLVAAVRQALGPKTRLMIDANHAYDPATAIALARKVERHDIFWFEEPVSPLDVDGYLEVKRNTTISLAGGECEYTRFGFEPLLRRRAVDFAQPDLCACGGISEGLKIASLASIYNIHVTPHAWGSAIGQAAALHFYAARPHHPGSLTAEDKMIKCDQTENPFRTEIVLTPIPFESGEWRLPQSPGLGVEIDKVALLRFRSWMIRFRRSMRKTTLLLSAPHPCSGYCRSERAAAETLPPPRLPRRSRTAAKSSLGQIAVSRGCLLHRRPVGGYLADTNGSANVMTPSDAIGPGSTAVPVVDGGSSRGSRRSNHSPRYGRAVRDLSHAVVTARRPMMRPPIINARRNAAPRQRNQRRLPNALLVAVPSPVPAFATLRHLPPSPSSFPGICSVRLSRDDQRYRPEVLRAPLQRADGKGGPRFPDPLSTRFLRR